MRFGPCMCGDICCPSCGPAQGNSKCEICGRWLSDECIHLDPDSGDYKAEFNDQVAAIRKAEEDMWNALAKEMEDTEKALEEVGGLEAYMKRVPEEDW